MLNIVHQLVAHCRPAVCGRVAVCCLDRMHNVSFQNWHHNVTSQVHFIFKSVWEIFLRASALWVTELSASSWQAGSACTVFLWAIGLFCSGGGGRGVGHRPVLPLASDPWMYFAEPEISIRPFLSHQSCSLVHEAPKPWIPGYEVILTFHVTFRACTWRALPATMLTSMGINIFYHAALLDFPNVTGYSYCETRRNDFTVRSVRMWAYGNVSCAPRDIVIPVRPLCQISFKDWPAANLIRLHQVKGQEEEYVLSETLTDSGLADCRSVLG